MVCPRILLLLSVLLPAFSFFLCPDEYSTKSPSLSNSPKSAAAARMRELVPPRSPPHVRSLFLSPLLLFFSSVGVQKITRGVAFNGPAHRDRSRRSPPPYPRSSPFFPPFSFFPKLSKTKQSAVLDGESPENVTSRKSPFGAVCCPLTVRRFPLLLPFSFSLPFPSHPKAQTLSHSRCSMPSSLRRGIRLFESPLLPFILSFLFFYHSSPRSLSGE